MMRNYAYMQGMAQLIDPSATIRSDEEDTQGNFMPDCRLNYADERARMKLTSTS